MSVARRDRSARKSVLIVVKNDRITSIKRFGS